MSGAIIKKGMCAQNGGVTFLQLGTREAGLDALCVIRH